MKCVVIVAWSLLGAPLRRMPPAFMCVVYATSVEPSQVPVVKPPRSCGRVLRRVRAPVHPNRRGRAIFPRADLPRDGRAAHRVGFVPDLHAERTKGEVERRPSPALPLDHRQLRSGVTERLRAAFVVERETRRSPRHRGRPCARAHPRGFSPPTSRRDRPERTTAARRPGPPPARWRWKRVEAKRSWALPAAHQVAEHGEGSHPFASACFLNCELTMNGCRRYFASSTTAVTTSS